MLERISILLFTRLLRRTSAPYWAVFAMDIFLAALSYILVITFSPIPPQPQGLIYTQWSHLGIYAGCFLISSLIVGSYRYIVRFSAIEDLFRILKTIVLSYIFLTSINFIVIYVKGFHYFGYWNIFLSGVISISLMISIRLFVKHLYSKFQTIINRKRKVIMLGTGIDTFAVAVALKSETAQDIYPVATLDINNSTKIKTASGIPIIPYSADTLESVFKEYESDTLLVLSSQFERFRSTLSDIIINHNFNIILLNKTEELLHEDGAVLPEKLRTAKISDINIDDLLFRDHLVRDYRNVREELGGNCVLITGAAGSIGSELTRQVAMLNPSRLVLVDIAETPMHDLYLEMSQKYPALDIRFIIGNVRDEAVMGRIFAQNTPKYVFHAAAYKHVPMMEATPSEAVMNNVFGTKVIADLSIRNNVRKFVFVSTDKAVNPSNVMGASKRIAEIYVQSVFNNHKDHGSGETTDFITTRFGNVLGSNGSVIHLFRKQIAAGGPITVTDKRIIRYFMTISEACSLVLEAGCIGNGGEIYIFDMGRPVRIYDLAIKMIHLAGLSPEKDIRIIETGLRPGEKLYEELLNNKEHTKPTLHNKIMVAQSRNYALPEVIMHLDKLKNSAESGDDGRVVEEMKKMVPEYKSQNSQWEIIDDILSDSSNPDMKGFILNENQDPTF